MTETRDLHTGFADVNGTRLYYEVAGTGYPLLLIHGGLVDRRLWGLSGFEPAEEDRASEAEVDEAIRSGNVARAVELTLRFWTDGPMRTPEQVNPAFREKVRAMTTRNFERPEDENATQPRALEPPAISRLSEIHVPTLIIFGDQDVRDILKIADILEKEIPGAKKVVIPDTAHHLNMEKPEEFNRIVLDFLGSLNQ